MKNALVDVRFHLNLTEAKVAEILAARSLDPANDDHYRPGLEAVEEWVLDNLRDALEYGDEPDVEADA